MGLMFFSSREGYDEPPTYIQENERREYGSVIPSRLARRGKVTASQNGCAGRSSANWSPNAISLFCGKKQGILAITGVLRRRTLRKTATAQCLTGEIPYTPRQGIFSARTGNFWERAGNEGGASRVSR